MQKVAVLEFESIPPEMLSDKLLYRLRRLGASIRQVSALQHSLLAQLPATGSGEASNTGATRVSPGPDCPVP